MFKGPKILVVTFWRAILYIFFILILLFININGKQPTVMLFNILNILTQLTLVSLFYSLVTILNKIEEKKAIVISFILYPACILLAMVNSLVFNYSIVSTLAIITGVVSIVVTINLLVQAFRMRKSHITIYFRVAAITLFIIPFNKIIAPIFLNFIYNSVNEGFLNALKVNAFINLTLFLFVPAAIILMIYKLKQVALVSSK